MKSVLLIILLGLSTYAYDGCGKDRNEALSNLSGNIKTRVNTKFIQNTKVSQNDTIEEKISSYLNTSANLTLVNVKYTTNKKEQICAHVEYDDQAKNTKKLIKKALLYKQENLPNNIDEKIKTLEKWLEDLDQLNYLIPVFSEDADKEQKVLNKKTKTFQDIYDNSIKQANSLVWRSCRNSKEEAKAELNKLLFVNKGVKEDKGFWESLTSAFSSTPEQDIDLFDSEISYMKKENKECATIKKSELLQVSTKMNEEVKKFNKNSLDKNPIIRYDQIKLYTDQFKITKKLITLFPEHFKSNDFANITRAINILVESKETTYPQYVLFNIKGATDIKIKIDDKFIKNNEKHYINIGEHSYTITAKDRCPINGSFNNDLKENKTIAEDFNDFNYPSVIFMTSKTPTVVVDGSNFPLNKKTPIKKCSDESIIYQAKYAEQTRTGELDLSPNAKNTVEFKFLTPKELAIFNDAKTRNFTTKTAVKFSESLTPQFSKNLKFSVGLGDGVSHGSLDLDERGSFVYQSDEDYVGIDSFTYYITAQGEQSAPKVVNIRIEKSDAPVALVPIIKKKDDNTTQEKKKEDVKEEKKKELTEKEKKKEEKYQRFKKYVESQEQDMQKLKKLQKKYPDMFNRLLKEKTAPGL